MIMRIAICCSLMAAFTSAAHAQTCGTAPPSAAEYAFARDVVSRIDVDAYRNAGTTCVPLQAHIVRTTGGTGGITQAQLNIGLSFLNWYYLGAGIEFFWKGPPNTVTNVDYYDYGQNSPDNDTETALAALFTTATNAVNIYFVNSMTSSTGAALCGYAYFPANVGTSNRIVMNNSCVYDEANGSFAHEMGHYFNLFHTHEGTENGNGNANAENVPRVGGQANCSNHGDLLCSTDADPRYADATFDELNCLYTGAGVDINGVVYTPPIVNIMSYYPDWCGGNFNGFTAEQYTRMAQGLVTRLGHSTYTLTAAPQSVLAASGLSVTLVVSDLQLNWTDNAANDLGYIVERSTISASTGFTAIPFAATAASATTWTDSDILSNTSYWYRVKAVNGDCNTYSNVATFTTGLVYCIPSYASPCDDGTALVVDEFVLTGAASNISNVNSNCSVAGYGNFTALSCTVNAGSSYAVVAKAVSGGGSYFPSYVAMWADWNHDGDFVDAGETVVATGSVMAPTFSGNIAVPVGAMNGATRLRVRAYDQANACAITACNQCVFGEAEDYTLTVTGGVTPGTVLAVKAWLEGPFVPGAPPLMNDALRSLADFPLTEPFTSLGFGNVAGGGGETTTAGVLATTGSNAIVDWVRIELRSSVDPTAIVATRNALIQRDGDVVSAGDGTSNIVLGVSGGTYYLAIRHRNHLGCMTAASSSLTGPAATVDFRSSTTATYGTAARKTIGSEMVLWAGNTVRDAPPPFKVIYTNTNNDREPILSAIGGVVPTNTVTGYLITDVNLDGVVKYANTGNDREYILTNIGGVVPTSSISEQLP